MIENQDTRRKPKPETTAFRVRLVGVARFRRCGIEFTTENTPYTVDAKGLTEGQKVELLNTHTLDVEALTAAQVREESRAREVRDGK